MPNEIDNQALAASGIAEYQFWRQIAALDFVEQIWLYGSRARGTQRERSDIDLAIICPNATQEDWWQIGKIMENRDTLLHVDFVRFDTLFEGLFKQNILRDKKVIYEREK